MISGLAVTIGVQKTFTFGGTYIMTKELAVDTRDLIEYLLMSDMRKYGCFGCDCLQSHYSGTGLTCIGSKRSIYHFIGLYGSGCGAYERRVNELFDA